MKILTKFMGAFLATVLALSLMLAVVPQSAEAGTVKWSSIKIPSATGMVLADVEVGPIAVTPDGGTIFAAIFGETAITGVVNALTWSLVKSTDGGHTWTAAGLKNQVLPITGIAISSNFATDQTMYVAAGATVHRSTTGGASFIALKPIVDSGANAVTMVNSVVMWPGTPNFVMVGATTLAGAGDVFVLKDDVFEDWRDQELNQEALAVAFAPDFATSQMIWAITSGGVVSATNSPGAWGTILGNVTLPAIPTVFVTADVAFPSDYNSTTPYLWVALSDGIPLAPAAEGGGLWRIRGLPVASQAIQQITGLNIQSVAASGPWASGTVLAGQSTVAGIRRSTNGGQTFGGTSKAAIGGAGGPAMTQVEMAPDFSTSSMVYIGTSDGLTSYSAFQVSSDAGVTCNATGLIDNGVVAGVTLGIAGIVDLALVDLNTIFMGAQGTASGVPNELWKTTNAADTTPQWELILTSTTATVPANTLTNVTYVEVSNQFATDGVVYVTDNATGIMKASDGGMKFAPMGAPGTAITALHVVDAIFAFTGAAANVYRTDDGGYSWLTAAVTAPVSSIAESPNYANDGTLLVGTVAGTVLRSTNKGASFTAVGGVLGAAGATFVAFDPDFATNSTIYGGNANGIFRFVIGTSTAWTNITAVPNVTGLATLGGSSTLYGADNTAGGGVQRSVNPTSSPTAPSFEAMNQSVPAGAQLVGLWAEIDETLTVTGSKNVLISIDQGTTLGIVIYTDTLAAPVPLSAPANKATVDRLNSATLSWTALTGATGHNWQVATDEKFVNIAAQGFLAGTSVTATGLTAGTKYYWRVRVDATPTGVPGSPLISHWSEVRWFVTELGPRVWAPVLLAPKAGATNVPLKPNFQWTGADWATGYELLAAKDTGFTDLWITKRRGTVLPSTAYVHNIDLDYATTYYWKVRALGADNKVSEWSDIGVFTTIGEPPVPPPPPTPPPTPEPEEPMPWQEQMPVYAWTIIGIGGLLVIVVIILIWRTRRPA
jgi:hypothetical protein